MKANRATTRMLCIGAACLSTGAVLASPAIGRTVSEPVHSVAGAAAREVSINESLRASLAWHHGAKEYGETGEGSGTFKCSLTIKIKIAFTHASITFTCDPRGGSISGRGEDSFYIAGSTTYFNGSVTFTNGTGQYTDISSNDLHIKGTIQRGSYALAATVTGKARL